MFKRQPNQNWIRSGVTSARGFTLLELLAVITVIAILASLLSAALNHTKGKAHRMACLNNMRQLQLGWFLYVDENEDQLPLNRTVVSPMERVFGRRNSTNSWVAGNPKEDETAENLKKGSLYHYVKSSAVYRCPSDTSTVIGKTALPRTRSYAMSAYLNGDGHGLDARVKGRFPEIVSPPPDKVFVFIEEHAASVWAGAFMVAPKERFSLNSGNWVSTPADYHRQGCNLTFADGHIEYWNWNWPKSQQEENKLTPNRQDLRDLRRLQEAIPKS